MISKIINHMTLSESVDIGPGNAMSIIDAFRRGFILEQKELVEKLGDCN